jgi:cobalt/nickel transport system ATP-binding protein
LTDTAALELLDVSFSYGHGEDALKNVSVRIASGERVALVGPNGAGKSTLLLAIVGVLHARGTVRVSGLELNRGTLKEIRRRVGLVFQNADDQLFMPTVREDVAFGPMQLGLAPDELEAAVDGALEMVGMTGLAAREPHHLSGGEKRAASIATVLSMRPSILALDEPTPGLDPRSRRRLIEFLKRLDSTCLVASHDLEMVLSLCERVVLLDGGSVVADGPSFDILADEKLMEDHGLEVPLSIMLGRRRPDPAD